MTDKRESGSTDAFAIRFYDHSNNLEITLNRVHIFDAESPARLDIFTEPLTGTSDRHKIETAFVIPRDTRRPTIQVVRQPSLKFDYKIRGTVWIDAVSLQLDPRP